MSNTDKYTENKMVKYLAAICFFSFLIWQQNMFLAKIRTLIVFDIDLARAQYLEEVRYNYMQGCLQGHEHYSVRRQPVTGFDIDSPTNYCSDWADRQTDYEQEQAAKLGRP